MLCEWWRSWTLCWILFTVGYGQAPPAGNYDTINIIASPADGNITISFKQPSVGTCTTVFETQKQYTGYVTLPPSPARSNQGNFTVNTFFWFIEARQLPETAPLTVFMNGGPGSSSMVGLFQEVGPCQVVEISHDRLGTVAREWGWDRSSNLLFIDQPVQTGFSFDKPTNASLNLLNDNLIYPPASVPLTQPSYTFLNGTFASNNPTFTSNTSQLAAESIWHFLQGFLATFPQYSRPPQIAVPPVEDFVEINLFTESYGGKYGPAIGSFFQEQSAKRQTDLSLMNSTIGLRLASIGIINGWIDALVQTPMYPMFAYQNSYSIQTIDQVQQLNALSSFRGAGGCQERITSCRSQELAYDADYNGDSILVNDACSVAYETCMSDVYAPYLTSGRSPYDIAQSNFDPFPASHYLDYLNTVEVQSATGVPVNFTQSSWAVWHAFNSTGDWARNSGIEDLVGLLNSGVRVALIYGDRDYVANWLGGEAVSFAIASEAGALYAPWYAAGYAPIVANNSYIGGTVREYGNLSFSRIYDAGHLVPAYQPETMFTVFSRIIAGTDISLGTIADLSLYSTTGDANATHQNVAPEMASPKCFIRAVNSTCDTDHRNMLANGAGVIINGVLYDHGSDWEEPNPTVATQAGMPGIKPTIMSGVPTSTAGSSPSASTDRHESSTRESTSLPTGVFTATGIPSVTKSSSGVAVATKPALSSREQVAAIMFLGCIGSQVLI
ncbi:uncharacterized protein HMPREF1541_03937 [Cyphellophora europaea CBS 101466]|uniref:Carboxypeptidase n=1 Tax=Cyphellophora europaea (strain CBS 101466) TaxID=1220924 RepID=W2S1S7_CYPE1|nr:uncharacterized protein HMPREF1541_03937 [Cyphellophora europaea CBS 101466]ETN41998.1 hypothetical protein HMPREF1541_03937 [Cyphellophora europaea CBS 101466]